MKKEFSKDVCKHHVLVKVFYKNINGKITVDQCRVCGEIINYGGKPTDTKPR